jgi:hypothetical protein
MMSRGLSPQQERPTSTGVTSKSATPPNVRVSSMVNKPAGANVLKNSFVALW